MVNVSAVIVARNEELNLPDVLDSLNSQTLPLQKIVVVNDGSTDKTGQVALQYGCHVIDLPFHRESYAGTPKIAWLLNVGLKTLGYPLPDYVLHLGADHILSHRYVETIVRRMEANLTLVLATGFIEGERSRETSPRGSGRIIRSNFWKKISNLEYPVVYCWEEWICWKALQLGYSIRCFLDVSSTVKRPTFGERGNEGKTMYALGYHWLYVLGKCFFAFQKSPRIGFKILWGWLRHKNVRRMKIAGWVNQKQKTSFHSTLRQILKPAEDESHDISNM